MYARGSAREAIGAHEQADKRTANTARTSGVFVCEDGACWWGRSVADFLISLFNRFVLFKTPTRVSKFLE